MPDGLLTIAALRVAFDFSMIFQQAANQFRHFFITFGFTDLQNKDTFYDRNLLRPDGLYAAIF